MRLARPPVSLSEIGEPERRSSSAFAADVIFFAALSTRLPFAILAFCLPRCQIQIFVLLSAGSCREACARGDGGIRDGGDPGGNRTWIAQFSNTVRFLFLLFLFCLPGCTVPAALCPPCFIADETGTPGGESDS